MESCFDKLANFKFFKFTPFFLSQLKKEIPTYLVISHNSTILSGMVLLGQRIGLRRIVAQTRIRLMTLAKLCDKFGNGGISIERSSYTLKQLSVLWCWSSRCPVPLLQFSECSPTCG
jgi:hypothetical protein